MKIIFTHH